MKKDSRFSQQVARNDFTKVAVGLLAIEAGNEEEDSDEDEAHPSFVEPIQFTASEVAQAFSHFTYWASGRK
jgi:hypothetical protein